jgi:hypothetical protein
MVLVCSLTLKYLKLYISYIVFFGEAISICQLLPFFFFFACFRQVHRIYIYIYIYSDQYHNMKSSWAH